MSKTEAKTVFIAGHQVDSDIAQSLLDAVLPSVKHVVEELTIAGKSDEHVKAAAKTTAFAVVESVVELMKQKANVNEQASPRRRENPQVQGDSSQQESS